ncbi:hypothetical protein [Streptosporangium sp. NPDC049304]|uniref:hypothetical protein n=1 Tax=Streptosporangium sp. NPDC049304 TaxID=3154830 RepID=UPI00342674DB
MKTPEDRVMAVADTVDPDGWMVTFNDLMSRIAAKPALAAEMIADAPDAGLSARWVSGDEVYGQDPRLRTLGRPGTGTSPRPSRPRSPPPSTPATRSTSR